LLRFPSFRHLWCASGGIEQSAVIPFMAATTSPDQVVLLVVS
jgi:hypothetical protein